MTNIILKETTGEFVVTKEAFEGVLNKFKKNNKRNYNFLVKGGDMFQHSMYLLVKRMIEESFGRKFGETTLYNIYEARIMLHARVIWVELSFARCLYL